MSANAIPAPATTTRSSSSLLRMIAGGTGIAAVLAAGAIALSPASETDKAYDDGQAFGSAVAQLQSADTSAEVDDALAELRVAATDTREHAGDAVGEQVDKQYDALYRAADGVVGSVTTDSEWDYDVYQWELDVAVDDLTSNAEDFRTTGPEVQQAFWDGYEDGLNAGS
jgi:hypothetical protein